MMEEGESCSTTVQRCGVVLQLRGIRKIRSHKHKAKNREYDTPQISLPSDFSEYAGKRCMLFEGEMTLGDAIYLQNKHVLIIAFPTSY
jgi:hypothetical protein